MNKFITKVFYRNVLSIVPGTTKNGKTETDGENFLDQFVMDLFTDYAIVALTNCLISITYLISFLHNFSLHFGSALLLFKFSIL